MVLKRNVLNTASFEWPKGASEGWADNSVLEMTQKLQMTYIAHFDGCMLGVMSKAPKTKCELIKKPWQTISTSASLTNILNEYKCNASHSHVPCAGVDTLQTGFYTK